MRIVIKKCLRILISFLCGVVSSHDLRALDLDSKQAYLIDMTTDTILYDKNSEEKIYPSSMTKMMAVYLVFEELKAGRLKGDQKFYVSEAAWRKIGSRMFLPLGESVRVDDLLKGIIIQSGNDATSALAEGIAGTESEFAAMMTRRAHEIGSPHTFFKNASGLPDPEHVSTTKDLANIAIRTIRDFPEYYPLYKEKEFFYNKIRQMNRNPLLYTNMGADGLKTGYTDLGGYGLAASAVDSTGRRLVLVINGASSKQKRADDARALMQYGFHVFVSPRLFEAKKKVESVDVWMGEEQTVDLGVAKDLYLTMQKSMMKNLKIEVAYSKPLQAPILAGDRVGKIMIYKDEKLVKEVPLVALRGVQKSGFLKRVKDSFYYLIWGHH